MDPVLYHTHHSLYDDDLPFWGQLTAARGGPVLELGCGTGRVLLPLAAEGYFTVGLDHDPEMLAFLRGRLPEENAPLVVRSDLRRFAFGVKFPLIILPCNTLTVLTAPDREALFHCIQRHLAPEGWFVASLPNPAILADLPTVGEPVVEEVFSHPNRGEEVQVSSSWQRGEDLVTISWGYDRLRDDGSVQHTNMDQVHHIVPVSTLETEIEETGLKVVKILGDYDGSSYGPDMPYCILISGLDE